MNFVTTQILIVDDNLEDQKNSHHYLLQDQQHNYNIVEAKTGEEALLLCRQEFPDVILLDYLLPDMDGLEVLKQLKAVRGTAEVPVLMLIEKGNETIAASAIATGACDYISKDNMTTETLRTAINFAITRDRNQHQLETDQLPTIITAQTCNSPEKPFAELSDCPFQALFDSALDAIAIADDDGRYIDVNPAACELFGLPKQKLLGLRIADFAAPGFDFSQAWQSFQEQGHLSGEFQLHRPDGTIREVEFKATSNFLPHHHLSILRDISDRKAAFAECKLVEAALRESERRYATLTEAAPVAIFWLDASGNCTYVNDCWGEMTGRPTAAAMGMGWLDTVHPDDRQQTILVWNQLFDNQQPEQPYRLEARILRPDHSILWFYCLMLPETDSTGSLIGYVGSLMDISDRKLAEQRLAQSESQYRLLFERNPNPMWIFDPETLAFLAVNQAAIAHYGYSQSEFLAMTLADIRPTEDIPVFQDFLKQYRLTDADFVYRGEWQHYKRDGSIIDVEITSSPIVWEGKPADFVMVKDITEHKQAQKTLQTYATELEELYNHAPCGYHSLDKDGTFVRINDTELNMLGYSQEEVVGKKKFSDLITPESKITFQENFPRFQERGWVRDLEFQMIRKDGTILPTSLSATAMKDAAGNYLVSRSMVVDISDRQQAQEKIREQAALLDITTDAIFVSDLQHCLSYWNSGAERLYGWQAAEVMGRNCREFLYQKISSPLEAAFKTVVEKGEWQGELNQITKSGEEIIVQSRWTLVCDRTGQPKSILCVDTDITEKKHLESQFYRAQRLESLGTLASGIAHDLNNILTPILTVAQLLKLKLPHLNEQNLRLLKILEDSSKRGAELVKQILSFVRGVEGKHVPLQLTHLLKEVEQVVKSTFPKSIHIHLHIPTPNLGIVLADPTQIHQVLMNLCVNARDAMPDGGNLSIAAENYYVDDNYARMNLEAKAGDYVVITVSDTGCGMSEEVRERIFEPFFTTKEHGKGTGLGLATVLGIIKNHGGFVNVQSELGEGSQFQIYLPAIEQGTSPATDELQTIRGKGELILVVDDEAFIRDVVKASLEEFNYKVLVASDGIEAFSLYAQHKNEISLVLMDIQMPSIDGLKAISILQQMNPLVKIIIISGLASNRKALQFSNINVQAFLAKPYRIKELLASIQEVLSKT
ncbi:PAS domain S-box protein [Calothrix sp. UHCC 0171]|uniref:PAS domain S-box protein n=1 Tax=Calothrix sp. UHCC 0171 TaxID=3110245 RepID=UPI002B20CBC9|nr:PAS domain S-box protein [Calothrix sp. UHCC 0171]MEA5572696.1 PAS domain S-box protein [Calothrix sp. UHCC 0171]